MERRGFLKGLVGSAVAATTILVFPALEAKAKSKPKTEQFRVGDFEFLNPVLALEKIPAGLLVTTTREWYIIAGGPNPHTQYCHLLARRQEGYKLDKMNLVLHRYYEGN